MKSKKPQRIRDPLHNLIEFDLSLFEQTLWQIVQTCEFQRLRRIKQLGFSEIVYPGATHTRFSHSLGVYHIAKKLLGIVKKHLGPEDFNDRRAETAIAAALLHDIGHGPFSHAFESASKRIGMKTIDHEYVGDHMIRNTEIQKILDAANDKGFSNNVADLIAGKGAHDIYRAIVSSQFDADRLDYIQRDRLMAGTQLAGIDFTWLMANLEVGQVQWGQDDGGDPGGEVDTFILGPKAIHAAEAYVLSLFQLYPTLYFHKATRCAEKLFCELLVRIFRLVEESRIPDTNLTNTQPLIQFAQQPDSIENYLKLDDTVIMGALSQMMDAEDKVISDFSKRLCFRNLYKCLDVFEVMRKNYRVDGVTLSKVKVRVIDAIKEWVQSEKDKREIRILYDEVTRSPYKAFDLDPFNQIWIRDSNKKLDIRDYSSVVKAIPDCMIFRVYYDENDNESRTFIDSVIQETAKAI